ncbi:MAG: hypothetical protein DCF25_07920 [Leptolyngbya foveolarum]|uniref:Protein kinase domain-containing protein n=1 Tax=Leptolyngbya foveolarum TaxID=47253 RepID=A0A2W4UKH8_9CYAN|nr:MAG: hypothetical protein DCF25_07920 [Leptolyngbya foveolarum]
MATFPTSAVIERLSDRYEFLQSIGNPLGYQQLLATDIQHRQSVVIKSLSLGKGTSAGDICCFEREVHLLESLRHPTIPRYIDSFGIETPAGKGLVLVQAHAPSSQTLHQQLVAGKTYREAEIKSIARQLLQGLVYLHSKGLVHRDITPGNVAIADSDNALAQVSWLNLGSVQYVESQRADAMVGTYGYMPVEQVGGQARFASDLYSLGATLIALATGRRPQDLPRDGHKIAFACRPSHLSASFQQWINWLIEPHISDRPNSAQQALKALNQLPFSMIKRRLKQPAKAALAPIPIVSKPYAQDQLYFTKIRQREQANTLNLTISPMGFSRADYKRAMPPVLMGCALLTLGVYLLSLLSFSWDMLSHTRGIASLAAAVLGACGSVQGCKFLWVGLRWLDHQLLREIHIQLEANVLLISYKYWLRSPFYIVNTRRKDIYNVSTLPDCSALRILTHRNRTEVPSNSFKLTTSHGNLTPRDIRWLTSLINDWRMRHEGCVAED